MESARPSEQTEMKPIPKHKRQRVLFDSLTMHFSFVVFFEQFFNHMFFPLLLPWMVYQHGWNCLIAQGFIPRSGSIYDLSMTFWHWGSPAIFYYVIFMHYSHWSKINMSITFPVLLYCMHRSMVALKYATLSPSELQRLLRGSNKGTEIVNYKWPSAERMRNSLTYQLQSMIISGYIAISSSMINLEIVVAGARAGIPLRDIYFEIADPNIGQKETLEFLRWQVFLSKALHIPLHDAEDIHNQNHMNKILIRQKDGSFRVNIHSVCVAIVHATCQCSQRLVGVKIIMMFSLLNTAIPAFMAERPTCRQDVCFFVGVLLMNFIYYSVMLNILYAAIQEMNRKSCFSNILESMIRLHDYNLKANVRFGGGGKANDDRVITSEIKTIQNLICENTDMIRLSTCCDCDDKGDKEMQGNVELRKSLLPNHNCDAKNRLKSTESVYADIEDALLDTDNDDDADIDSDEDATTDPDTDIESPPLSQAEISPGYKPSEHSPLMALFTQNHSSLISDSSVEVPNSSLEDFHFPQIELLKYKDNFTTWMQCRKILHSFGYRFSFRLNTLLVVILILLLSLSLWLVARVITTHDTNPMNDSGIVQTILWIVVYAFALAFIIFVAHMTNIKNIAHRETINSHMLNMKQALRRTPQENIAERKHLEECIEVAYSTTHSVAIMNEVHPVRIFGIVANARTSAFIIYVVLVFLYVLFQYSSSGTVSVPT